MAIEHAVAFERADDEEACTKWLKLGWQPFAVDKGLMYFRTQLWNEDNEPRSSTREENTNWAGTKTTE